MADALTRIGGRFPTSPGILLGAALALHIASLAEALLGTPLAAGALFLIGQFLIALALIRLYDGDWKLQDIRLFFVVFFFLYGGTLPLVVLLGMGSATDPGLSGAAFMYGTAFLGFNFVQWWYRQPYRDIPPESFARIRPTYLNAAIVVAAFLFVGAYALALGVRPSLTIDRSQLGYLGTRLWVVTMFVVNGLVMFMVAGWQNLRRPARIAVALSVVAFVAFQVSMGNRRDFLAMLVFLVGMILVRRRAVIRLGSVLAGAAAFMAMTLVGVLRQIASDPGAITRNPVELLVTHNEFVSPIYTLMYYVGTSHPLRWGATYLGGPALLVPRALWPDKPDTLSLQFMRDAFGTTGLMGFAYTPVTEAFLNFSWVGPFFVFTIISLLMVKLVRNAHVYSGTYLIAFAMVVDFNRGEFGGIFYAVTMIGGAYAVMSLLSRLRWEPEGSRRLWPGVPATGSAVGPPA